MSAPAGPRSAVAALGPVAPTGGKLGRSQEARRRRLMDAATELAAAGGYDAVQMRDVAARAGVALGTIYRYYSSKDHLLAEVQVAWITDLEAGLADHPYHGSTPLERLLDLIRRSTAPLERSPRVGEVFVRALNSSDDATAACQRRISDTLVRLLTDALVDLDPERRAGVIKVLLNVWYAALVGWVNGWEQTGTVRQELELTARLLLRDDAGSGAQLKRR